MKVNLNKKVDYIGVDIDSSSVYDLLFSYLKARRLFPKERIDVSISPSGFGFHLIIHKKVTILENIYYRIILHDDPWRIVLSLKKFFINPHEEYFDIIFDSKWGNNSKKIDLKKILDENKSDVEFIFKKWGTNEALRRLVELSDKVADKIDKPVAWLTCFAFTGNELKDKLNKICEDIRAKDSSFKYRIYESYIKGADYMLVISSSSKDQAFQRGEWFLRILDDEDKSNIKKFDGKYYWVKKKV